MSELSDGMLEAPGFIDAHSHDDLALLADPERAVKQRQGIVHQVIGNCGLTPFPLAEGDSPEYEAFLTSVLGHSSGKRWSSNAEKFLSALPGNVTPLVGYNTLRLRLFPHARRPLEAPERQRISCEIHSILDLGATGVSIGLAYQPALFADCEELVALAEATPLLTIHMRNETSRILESIDEIVDAVAEAGRRGSRCHLHISHLKICGRGHWHLLDRLMEKVRGAHEEIGLTFDHYPFSFGSTGLASLLPPELGKLPRTELREVADERLARRFNEDDWENFMKSAGPENLIVVGLREHSEWNGTSLDRPDAARFVLELVLSEPSPVILIKAQSDEIIDELLRLPFGCVGSDALPDVAEHPRLTETFPEYLRRMKHLGQPLEFAVEKASVLPRRIFKIANESRITLNRETYGLMLG